MIVTRVGKYSPTTGMWRGNGTVAKIAMSKPISSPAAPARISWMDARCNPVENRPDQRSDTRTAHGPSAKPTSPPPTAPSQAWSATIGATSSNHRAHALPEANRYPAATPSNNNKNRTIRTSKLRASFLCLDFAIRASATSIVTNRAILSRGESAGNYTDERDKSDKQARPIPLLAGPCREGSALAQQLAELPLHFLFGGVLRQHELADENLASVFQHLSFARG